MPEPPSSLAPPLGGIQPVFRAMAKTVDYRDHLNQRYWAYQDSRFPDWEKYFDRPNAHHGRPPVFLAREAWRNVIFAPDVTPHDKARLLTLVPDGERHKWFRSMNSSQALAQSVFGNLAIHGLLQHLTELDADEGNALLGNAQPSADNFAMEFKIDYLGEPRRTSLDGYVAGNYRVAIECKFTEQEMGSCSRPRLTPANSNYESEYCDGTYARQRTRMGRCSLTEVGVSYWGYVPRLFHWPNDRDFSPCPLNNNYQLVRNVLAVGVKPDGAVSVDDGHAILIYDERNPAFQVGGSAHAAYTETRRALLQPTMLRKCSWQRIIRHIRHGDFLPWLTEQLALKYGF
jgi:hypothetical protein